MLTRMLMGGLLLAAWGAEADARCSVPLIQAHYDQAVDGRMTVSSGGTCRIKLKSSGGPTYGARIVQAPSQGTVAIDGSNRIVYHARAGYVGSDSFAYARTGETMSGRATTYTVRIAVTVVR